MIAAACLALASCDKKENTPSGSETSAPVLGEIAGAVLEASGSDVSTTYTAADFGVSAVISYTLYVDLNEDFSTKAEVNATIADGKISVTPTYLSSALVKAGGTVGESAKYFFRLDAAMGSVVLSSNVVSAEFTPFNAEIDDLEAYDHIWAIGAYNGWAFDAVQDFLFNRNGDGKTYEGLLYFRGKAVSGWKLAVPNNGNWDDSANWGAVDNPDYADEAETIQLVCSGGSGNIFCYSKNFYYFVFDKEAVTLSVNQLVDWEGTTAVSFDNLYLVGSINGWGDAFGNTDYEFKWSATKRVFYIDATVAVDDELKFMASSDWKVAWGGENGTLAWEGNNLKITEAGNYRIYVDINKGTYKLDAAAYGTEEEGGEDVIHRGDDPDKYEIRGADPYIEGLFDWSAGAKMTGNDDFSVYTYSGLAVKAGAQIKVVKNDGEAWLGINDLTVTLDGAAATGSDNIDLPVAGGYDLTLTPEAKTLAITTRSTGWAVVGNIENADGTIDSWTVDFPMKETAEGSGIFISETLTIHYDPDNKYWGCKIRYFGNWEAGEYGAPDTNFKAGESFAATDNSTAQNIAANGKFKVVYNANAGLITLNQID